MKTKTERNPLKSLNKRNDIVIKSAKKGSATVVMDRDWYIIIKTNVYDNSTTPNSTDLLAMMLLLTSKNGYMTGIC